MSIGHIYRPDLQLRVSGAPMTITPVAVTSTQSTDIYVYSMWPSENDADYGRFSLQKGIYIDRTVRYFSGNNEHLGA